ncbi:MAG: EAL domain-containing protein [Gammaproteobacteria bacterium]|nr:hypothetical protein [Gammaproteobacteria bacterium]
MMGGRVGGSLLLVDDEPHVCEGLRRILYREGYRIHTANGPDDALEILANHQVDVIVSDQRMPKRKGTELLAEVARLYPRTVRMILSGAADVDEVARAMENGAIYKFLTKPIEPTLLRANVKEAFSRAASLRPAVAAAAGVDPDTGLPRRRRLELLFPRLMADARSCGRRVCLLMLKIDQYDHVISSFGYSFGRRFLRRVATMLREKFSAEHFLACDSPGTFLLLTSAPNPSARIDALDAALDHLFARPLEIDGRCIVATVSIGAAAAEGDIGFDELVDRTYAAMKTGSERGGATMQIFLPQLVSAFRGQLELESDLRQAAITRDFLLHYQPQIDLATGKIAGVEALLRWPHPSRGFVSPKEFVPVAERVGLIPELGAWVLESAVAQLAAWRDEGLAFGEVAVNVSALELKEPGFVGRVGEVLERFAWPACRLVLEVTESTAIGQEPTIVKTLEEVGGMGVKLAVDDFGTGYANLANLTRFAFRKLKIDRSLLPGRNDERGQRLYERIVGISSELGLDVVAEGVETQAELAFVRGTGCKTVQGYFFSAPLSPDRLVKFATRK